MKSKSPYWLAVLLMLSPFIAAWWAAECLREA